MPLAHFHESAIPDEVSQPIDVGAQLLPIVAGDPDVLGGFRETTDATTLAIDGNRSRGGVHGINLRRPSKQNLQRREGCSESSASL